MGNYPQGGCFFVEKMWTILKWNAESLENRGFYKRQWGLPVRKCSQLRRVTKFEHKKTHYKYGTGKYEL
ncbi:MAG TPA: hypothetical protein DIC60_04255 [Lachnospiraceae bacterium]|nr:hypothetical protein [Lachnospiraceae bacterium]HCT64471.1 hypothetical protein [Lachnospiraceae bacterium]